ncbi:31083_t:CDS:2, partial [Gigaspora margarita]
CFDEIENEIVDVLAGNLQYEKPTFSNREEEQMATELLSVSEALSEDSKSSLEEEEEQNTDKQPVTIDQRAVNLVYDHVCEVNVLSISLASSYKLFRQFLPLNYIKQFVIDSIIYIEEMVRFMGINVCFPVADYRFYWRTNPEITQPMVPFNFQCWMSHLRFEQIVSYHTLMMPNKLDAPNFNDPLYSVRSFINAFNIADSFTNIIIQLEPCEEKKIEKS